MAKKNAENQPREYTKRQLSHAKKQQLRQRIYLYGGITVIAAVILLTMAGWLFGEFLPMNKAIVSISDEKITERDLIDTMVIYGSAQTGLDIAQNMDYILQAMIQNILIERTAKDLGITVSDKEISDAVPDKINNARKTLVRASLLTEKLRKDYFGPQVGDSGNQVLMNTMMVESEELVPGIRQRLINGEAFTTLAEEFALNVVSKTNKGVFDWHPQVVLSRDISTSIPSDWAFKDDVKKGDISDALADNVSSKQLGYWLIKLNQRLQPEDIGPSANVSALLLSSRAEALKLKAQLDAGASLADLADKFSQYSPSQQGHGQFITAQSENVSTNFNTYVFNIDTLTGEWSNPIQDDRYYTKGGAWVVQVVDKSKDHPYSDDDKNTLIDNVYSEWVNGLWTGSTADIAYTFEDAERALAIQKATKEIANLTAGN